MSKLLFDAQTTLVDSVAGEAALAPERLTSAWLREHFAEPRHWLPETINEPLLNAELAAAMPAAVLIAIVAREEGLTLLFTQRTAHLTDHAGQVSFPGGRVEASDASPTETALRETEEEIGLSRQHVEVLGILPDYFTATGYRVTPVVALVHPPFELQADPHEVAEIFEVPLSFLMDGLNHQRRTAEFPDGGRRSFYAMPYDRFFIWGATAGMLRNLFHFLRA